MVLHPIDRNYAASGSDEWKYEHREHLWNDTDRGKPKYAEKNVSHTSATLSTTNPTQTALGSKPGVGGEMPAINRVICSTA
jgi:hypothetical protein